MAKRKKESHTPAAPKAAKKDRHWTLLFIGDRGKTITFKRFKGAVITTVSIMVVTAAVAGGFYYLYLQEKQKNKTLQNDMDNLRQVVTSLRNEKDILTARLIVVESRIDENLTKIQKSQSVKISEKSPETDSRASAKSTPTQTGSAVSVDVGEFIVFYEPDVNTLRVQFRLLNTGSKAQPVSGKSIVVLKNTDQDQIKWLTMPSVPLISGKPSGKYGRTFSIYNFRTMKFKVNDQAGPDQFNTATVFIFSLTGDLLLEKDFPMGIKSQRVSTSNSMDLRSFSQ
jgi:hypothetical protein